jgi:hypothetical protein
MVGEQLSQMGLPFTMSKELHGHWGIILMKKQKIAFRKIKF